MQASLDLQGVSAVLLQLKMMLLAMLAKQNSTKKPILQSMAPHNTLLTRQHHTYCDTHGILAALPSVVASEQYNTADSRHLLMATA